MALFNRHNSRNGSGERDDVLLEHYYGGLLAMFQTLEPEKDGYSDTQVQTISRIKAVLNLVEDEAEPGKIMNVSGKLPDNFDWEDGHLAEILLAYVRPQYQLREAIQLARAERTQVGLDPIDTPPAFDKLAKFAETQPDAAAAILTHNEWKSLRQHLATLIRHNKREAAQKHLKRDYGKQYARLQAFSVILVVLLFALVLFFGGVFFDYLGNSYSASTRNFSGLIIATSAGLLGASLSQLRRPLSDFEFMTVAAATVMRRPETILISNLIGATGAAVLYFFFQADAVDVSLFPDLSEIGFTQIGTACGQTDGPACVGLEGGHVPNSDLCKLIIWCIAAGFSEKLVPSLLDRVSQSASKKTTTQ